MNTPGSVAIAFAGLLLATAGIAAAATQNTCFITTRLMTNACRADITDDLYEQKTKCKNTDDRVECTARAYDDYVVARAECGKQAEGRDALCARLPAAGPYIVDLDPEDFTGACAAGNPYFPLVPGRVTTFVNDTDEPETIIVTVTHATREIEGIDTIVVQDRVFAGLPDAQFNPTGEPIESTDDYYAVDNDCNVWYFGEIAQNFEGGYLTNLNGSFIAGENGAQAGIVMLADPQVGDVYRQEFALGDAEDAAEVLALDEDNPVLSGVFDCAGACLKTEDFVGPNANAVELKYYAPGVGFVAEELPNGEVVLELVKIDTP